MELRKTDKRHQDAKMAKEKMEFIVKRVTKVLVGRRTDVRVVARSLLLSVLCLFSTVHVDVFW